MPEVIKVSKFFLLIEKFQKLDRGLIYMILLLGFISILSLYSIDKGQGSIYLKHATRFAFAFFVLLIVAFKHISFWYRLHIIYIFLYYFY
jgi:cell division protein FtsW (lipid II flippase)